MKRRLGFFSRKRRLTPVGLRPTLGGMWFMIGVTLIGLAAIDADVNLLLVIFGFSLGGILVNLFYCWRTLPALRIRRIVPETAVAGQPFTIRYALTNTSRFAVARNLHIEEFLPRKSPATKPEVFVASLAPGDSITVSTQVALPTRGRLNFSSLRISTRFPFHLFVKWVRIEQAQEVIVFPQLGRLRAEVKPGTRALESAGADGSMGWSRGDEEFYGVREYREGDNPRRIHWRRSARTGQLMIREMAQPKSYQLWCVINTRIRPYDAEQSARLEAAISAAATVICDALERGAKIGLICNGEPFVVSPPGSGRAYRPRLLTELAIRGRNEDDELAAQIYKLTWPSRLRSPCLLFGANNDEDMRAAARALNRAIGQTTIYVPGTPAFDQAFGWPEGSEFERLKKATAPRSNGRGRGYQLGGRSA